MAPVIRELRSRPWARVRVLCSAQHRDLIGPLLRFFGVEPDIDLDCMTTNQGLADLTGRLVCSLTHAFEQERPDLVLAQGDTTTVMCAALSSFYARIPFGHVEAGLRTNNLDHPYPEELNRLIVSRIARWNFAPTERAAQNLQREGVDPRSIITTGNTVIDALHWTTTKNISAPIEPDPSKRLILLTAHRRENFGAPLKNIFEAVSHLVEHNKDVVVLYPVHPNPHVAGVAYSALRDRDRIVLCEPLEYPELIATMRQSFFILTDSGGIQEEAPALGKPVLVLRQTTERPEAVQEGCARLVGVEKDAIIAEAQRLLDCPLTYRSMARQVSPYGDGYAAQRIADTLQSFANGRTDLPDRKDFRHRPVDESSSVMYGSAVS